MSRAHTGTGWATLAAALLVCSKLGLAAEPAWVNARVTTTLQLFEQALVPGLPGAVTKVEPATPFTLWAFTRFGGLPSKLSDGVLSGEVSAWGRLGPLDASKGDGDLSAAWVRYTQRRWRVQLGRQVALPGSARYVRFDGATLGVTLGRFDLEGYGGWVALPRWSRPRGAFLAGFATDALRNPALLESQDRAGQVTYGARLSSTFSAGRVALAFHEQRDAVGVAFRVLSADGLAQVSDKVAMGARLTVDSSAWAVSEARLWADVKARQVPLSIDYAFANPALLLPRTSILAAFGSNPWHEVGIDGQLTPLQTFKLTARASAQRMDDAQLGARASLKATWLPDVDQRLVLLAEAGRALVPPSGFTFGRAAARGRLLERWSASFDGAVYAYDVPIRGQRYSLTGVASLEWTPFEKVHGLVSATVMSTPYSVFEMQALARVSVELGTVREGAIP